MTRYQLLGLGMGLCVFILAAPFLSQFVFDRGPDWLGWLAGLLAYASLFGLGAPFFVLGAFLIFLAVLFMFFSVIRVIATWLRDRS